MTKEAAVEAALPNRSAPEWQAVYHALEHASRWDRAAASGGMHTATRPNPMREIRNLVREAVRVESTAARVAGRAKVEEVLNDWQKAAPLCDEHQPSGGARSSCLVCGLRQMSYAFSRIDYMLGEPNDMEVSDYDLHCDENVVVERLRALLAEGGARC